MTYVVRVFMKSYLEYIAKSFVQTVQVSSEDCYEFIKLIKISVDPGYSWYHQKPIYQYHAALILKPV